MLRISNETYTIYDEVMDGFTLSVTHLNIQQSTRGHKHSHEEVYYFVGGMGMVEVGDSVLTAYPGKTLRIPSNVFHRVCNDGLMPMTFICGWKNET